MGTTDGARRPSLELSVLGPIRARRDGIDLVLGGRRQRGVLARLALAGGRSVATERLVDELWDGDPPASALNTLQSYVSHLRRILGGPDPIIERAGDGYRLRTEDVHLDTAEAESLLGRATAGLEPSSSARLELVEAALALWHGPALGDLADEPWARGDVVRLTEIHLAATETRFELLLDLGRHTVAAADLEATARAHPLRERFTALSMLALYRCGRQAEALRAHERLRTHLAEELGLDPSPELALLARRVLTHDPGLDLVLPEAATSAPGVPAPPAEPLVGLGDIVLPLPPAVTERRARSPFVGRAAELDQLSTAWGRVVAGGRELALLEGEPGTGKSRLAQQLARRVHDEGGNVLWGRCTAENLVAYQPVVEALRTGVRTLPPDAAEAVARDRPAIGVLLPDLAGAEQLPERVERWDLFEAVVDVLGEATTATPLLLVVDDGHWADASTVALVDHIVRQGRQTRVLVVVTARRPSGRPTPELDRLVVDLRREQRLEAVAVTGIGTDEVVALLEDRGVPVSRDEADALRARTGGNPFFLEALVEHGGVRATELRAVPASVRDVLDERLQVLGDDALLVLSAAAVIGARSDLAVLGQVVDLDPEALLDVVDVAVTSHLLVEDEELGWVGFPHALVRSALVSRLSRNREARLHLRIAEVVEGRSAHLDREATVAQHLLAAGRIAPAARTATAAVAAGRRALTGLADEDALAWADRALAALDAGAGGAEEDAACIEALLLKAEAGRLVGDSEATRLALGEVMALATASDDIPLRLRVASEAIFVHTGHEFPWGLEPPDETLVALVSGGPDLPDEHAAIRPVLMAWETLALVASTRRPTAIDRSQRAMAEVDAIDDPLVAASVRMTRRQAIAGPAGLEERLAQHDIVLAVDHYGLRVGVMVLVEADLWEAGRYDDARAAHVALHDFMDPHPRPWYNAYLTFADGMVAYLEGDVDAGTTLFEAGLAAGEPAHAGPRSQFGIGGRVMAARAHGAETDLRGLADEVRTRRPDLAVASALEARVLVAEGRDDEARAVVGSALAGRSPTGSDDDLLWYLTVDLWAEVAGLLDHPALGAAVAAAVAPYADRIGVIGQGSLVTGSMHVPHGLALAAAGDRAAAEAALSRAIALGEAAGLRPTVARAQAALTALRTLEP